MEHTVKGLRNMYLAWELRSGCLDVTTKKGLVSTDNMRGFGQDPWEKYRKVGREVESTSDNTIMNTVLNLIF